MEGRPVAASSSDCGATYQRELKADASNSVCSRATRFEGFEASWLLRKSIDWPGGECSLMEVQFDHMHHTPTLRGGSSSRQALSGT